MREQTSPRERQAGGPPARRRQPRNGERTGREAPRPRGPGEAPPGHKRREGRRVARRAGGCLRARGGGRGVLCGRGAEGGAGWTARGCVPPRRASCWGAAGARAPCVPEPGPGSGRESGASALTCSGHARWQRRPPRSPGLQRGTLTPTPAPAAGRGGLSPVPGKWPSVIAQKAHWSRISETDVCCSPVSGRHSFSPIAHMES